MARPTVAYFLSTSEQPVEATHPLWSAPIPTQRCAESADTDGKRAGAVSYGQYFSAIHRFCAKDGWAHLASACALKLQRPVTPHDIQRIDIHLVKHGAFYHPSRLRIGIGDVTVALAVNVALSSQGRRALPSEVLALARLADERPFDWFPAVYHSDEEDPPMFLADWFDGFHEFHLTRTTDTGNPAVMIWDGATRPRLLNRRQVEALYRQASMILTASYDPISTDHIRSWHHAAGDFVLRLAGDREVVKLITVRDYGPLIDHPAIVEDAEALMAALLLFFVDLSVRMRLDRRDGVHEVVWAPSDCLQPMVHGFFQGLDLTARLSGFPGLFKEAAKRYFQRCTIWHLLPVADRVTAAAFGEPSEARCVVEDHLDDHIRSMARILSSERLI